MLITFQKLEFLLRHLIWFSIRHLIWLYLVIDKINWLLQHYTYWYYYNRWYLKLKCFLLYSSIVPKIYELNDASTKWSCVHHIKPKLNHQIIKEQEVKKKILNSKISNLNREKKVSLKRSEWVIENIAPIIDGRNTMTGLS